MGDRFCFKRFAICQDRTAMKVGTDGVLLGAWARGGRRILDVGCGTGLIALMMAQRFPKAEVTAIDIDLDAAEQARENVMASPFAERVKVFNESLQTFGNKTIESYDSVVCNPPFFSGSLQSPDGRRTVARHDDSLPLSALLQWGARLLDDGGEMSVILPCDRLADVRTEGVFAGFFESRLCRVKTVEGKAPKRALVAFRKERAEQIEESEETMMASDGERSPWLSALVGDFYLDVK